MTAGNNEHLNGDNSAALASLSEYLTEKHRALASDYRDNCLTIAKAIAGFLLAAGKQPYLVTMVRLEMRGENKFYNAISPLQYGRRITWTRHYACCCDGKVYDPMLAEPIAEAEYSMRVFGVEIAMEKCAAGDEIAAYIHKPVGPPRP